MQTVKISFFILLICNIGLCELSIQEWKTIEDDFFSIQIPYRKNESVKAQYPRLIGQFLYKTLGWDPGLNSEPEVKCSNSPKLFGTKAVQSDFDLWVDNCPATVNSSTWLSPFKSVSQFGNLKEHPFVKYGYLNFPTNLKTRMLLGIKDLEKKDLIIFRPGVFVNLDDLRAEKYLVYILTEILNVHIIMLESSTSAEHLVNNAQSSVGGISEAYENLYLVNEIRKNKVLSRITNKIHFFGMSLGGNGVLAASLINQSQHYKYFDRTILFCPVVNVISSFEARMQPGAKSFIFDLWSSSRFLDLLDRPRFELSPLLPSILSLKPRWIRAAWEWFQGNYQYHPEWSKVLPNDFHTGDYRYDHLFQTRIKKLPENFYVLATRTDPIVSLEDNFNYLKQFQDPKKQIFKIFENGVHCSFPYTYQWKFIVSMLKSLFGQTDTFKGQSVEIKNWRGELGGIKDVQVFQDKGTEIELKIYSRRDEFVLVTMKKSIFGLDPTILISESNERVNLIKRIIKTSGYLEQNLNKTILKFDL